MTTLASPPATRGSAAPVPVYPIDARTGFDFGGWLEQARADIGERHAAASVIWPVRAASVVWPVGAVSKRFFVHLFDRSIPCQSRLHRCGNA